MSGKLPVTPKPNIEIRPAGKNKTKKFTPLILSGITVLIMVAAFIAVINFANSDKKIKVNDEELKDKESGEIEYYLSDSEICGRWTLIDYVENIGDFSLDDLNYVKYGIKLYSSDVFEFFEDGGVIVNCLAGEEKKYRWINTDKFNILSDHADTLTMTINAINNIGGINYMFIEAESESGQKLSEIAVPEISESGYYVLKRNRDKELFTYDDIRDKDIRNYNLSDANNMIRTFIFNEKTRFPSDKSKMPQSDESQPGYILERGTNPGLGIRELNKRGITGKGVNIAIIAEPPVLDHPEYKNKIAGYKDFSDGADSSFEGSAVASLLAGENTGVSPGVNIYYAAVPPWNSYDAEYYAKALDWIVEINKTLPVNEKIKAVCISPNPENPMPWINVDKYLKSFQNAEKDGLLVLDCTNEHGAVIGGCGYDFDDPEDVSLCKSKGMYRIIIASYHYDKIKEIFIDEDEANGNMLRAPVSYRTMAAENNNNGGFSYQYDGKGQLSWAIPYVTGVLAMGWQVRPELTADEMINILFETAYVDDRNNKYIYPVNFIEYLEKN